MYGKSTIYLKPIARKPILVKNTESEVEMKLTYLKR